MRCSESNCTALPAADNIVPLPAAIASGAPAATAQQPSFIFRSWDRSCSTICVDTRVRLHLHCSAQRASQQLFQAGGKSAAERQAGVRGLVSTRSCSKCKRGAIICTSRGQEQHSERISRSR
jgi:hypothetical protein